MKLTSTPAEQDFMPIEIVGEVGTPGAETEWIEAQGKLVIHQLIKVCGDPPPEKKSY